MGKWVWALLIFTILTEVQATEDPKDWRRYIAGTGRLQFTTCVETILPKGEPIPELKSVLERLANRAAQNHKIRVRIDIGKIHESPTEYNRDNRTTTKLEISVWSVPPGKFTPEVSRFINFRVPALGAKGNVEELWSETFKDLEEIVISHLPGRSRSLPHNQVELKLALGNLISTIATLKLFIFGAAAPQGAKQFTLDIEKVENHAKYLQASPLFGPNLCARDIAQLHGRITSDRDFEDRHILQYFYLKREIQLISEKIAAL